MVTEVGPRQSMEEDKKIIKEQTRIPGGVPNHTTKRKTHRRDRQLKQKHESPEKRWVSVSSKDTPSPSHSLHKLCRFHASCTHTHTHTHTDEQRE
jgi:hypothetical protein